ncbi:hypothetical protein [Leisingera sp. ANG-M1]|uniref:hypothetical protein n=1 Tax=Leisingera sp. ANG-M1 TaxID=1577895 RepID=UPI00126A01CE|nr:hypothetical protein [Leisingera sp. ANG-M1]
MFTTTIFTHSLDSRRRVKRALTIKLAGSSQAKWRLFRPNQCFGPKALRRGGGLAPLRASAAPGPTAACIQ